MTHYEEQIVAQLRNAVVDTGKSFRLGEIKNSYHVKFDKGHHKARVKGQTDDPEVSDKTSGVNPINPSQEEVERLVCSTKTEVDLKTFVRGSAPFFATQQLDEYFVEKPLLEGKTFESCGVVSSSGSLVNAQLGKVIDANEFVIRFNNAPTSGYERDVGTKTPGDG